MDSHYTRPAAIGLGIGLPLFIGGWALVFFYVRGHMATFASTPGIVAIVMIIVSIPLYLWGCAALANAKGYSTAIVLTCILGWLFPLVVLLALPDKCRHHSRSRRRPN